MNDPVRTTCPGCQQSVKANPKLMGKTVKCPKCGSNISIPSRETRRKEAEQRTPSTQRSKPRRQTPHEKPAVSSESDFEDYEDYEAGFEDFEDFDAALDDYEDYEDYEAEPTPRRRQSAKRSKVDKSVTGLWRDGKIVVMAHGAKMPKRCFKSGAKDVTKKRIELGYTPPAKMLGAVALGVLTAATTGVAVTAHRMQKVELSIYYSKSWKQRRLIRIFSGLGICALGCFLIYYSLVQMICGLALFGCFCMVGGLIFGLTGDHISAQKIDDQYVRLRGAGNRFLETLPEWKKGRKR